MGKYIGVEVFLFKLCVRFNPFRVTLSVSVRVMFSVIVRDKVSVFGVLPWG